MAATTGEPKPLPPWGMVDEAELESEPKQPKQPKEVVDEVARAAIQSLGSKTFDAIIQLAHTMTHVPAIQVGNVKVPPVEIPAPVIKVMPVTEWDFTIEHNEAGRISRVIAKAK